MPRTHRPEHGCRLRCWPPQHRRQGPGGVAGHRPPRRYPRAGIGQVVTQFGCKSPTFAMIELPANLHWYRGARRPGADVRRVPDKLGVVAAGAIFNQPGAHRRSPWFKVASVLRLNTIGEARETVRAWAEASWDSPRLKPRPGPDGRRQVRGHAGRQPVRRTEVTAPPPPLLIFPRPRVFG